MENSNELKGLGGWLILVGIGVVIAPIRLLTSFIPVYSPIMKDGAWDALTSPGSLAYHPLWEPLLIAEITYNLAMVAASLYLIYLFFSKHYLFPRFFIGIAIASLIFIPLDAWVVSTIFPSEPMLDPDTAKGLARTVGVSLIWIPYMLVSERVKNTFVEKRSNNWTSVSPGT